MKRRGGRDGKRACFLGKTASENRSVHHPHRRRAVGLVLCRQGPWTAEQRAKEQGRNKAIGYILNSMRIPWMYYAIAGTLLIALLICTKRVALSLLLPYMLLIFASTVLSRSAYATAQFDWLPFRMLWQGKSRDHLLQLASNVVMFIPLGLLCPLVTKKRPLLWAVLFSCVIEVSQLIGHRGVCETDDVLCNALGAVIGYVILRCCMEGEPSARK